MHTQADGQLQAGDWTVDLWSLWNIILSFDFIDSL